jgi:hypothetical protein
VDHWCRRDPGVLESVDQQSCSKTHALPWPIDVKSADLHLFRRRRPLAELHVADQFASVPGQQDAVAGEVSPPLGDRQAAVEVTPEVVRTEAGAEGFRVGLDRERGDLAGVAP